MKKQNTIRAGILMLLFFAFGYAQAGFIPVVVTTPACHVTDGSVTITGTGDPGPYAFFVNGNGAYYADSNVVSSSTFTGLTPGSYQYVAYSADWGDQTIGTFTITSAVNILTTVTQPVCPTGTTGSAIVTVTDGATPYTYLWSTGATAQSVSGLPTGISTVLVTDANGCSAMAYDTIQIISPYTASIVRSGPACNGVLTAAIAGNGTAPYNYLWSTGATTVSITGLINGNFYQLEVTDAHGCEAFGYLTAVNTSLAFDSVNTHGIEPTCGANGSITIAMASGTAPFTYLWSNGATGVTVTGLASNNYAVTVTDANGCTGQNSYYLYGNPLQQYNYSQNPACGTLGGAIGVGVWGGTGPYGYSWSNDNSNHTDFDTLLTAGTYHYTISDAAGCVIIDSATLIPEGNFSAQVTVTNIICPSNAGGSMTVTVTGTGPYTYLWTNGATTQTVNNLAEGTYLTVTATDNNGCETLAYSDSVTVTAPFNVTLSSIACNNTVIAGTTSGGTAPYTYLWSNGVTTAAITYNLNANYWVTVTDAHGCSNSQFFYANTTGVQLDSLNSVTNPTCNTPGSIVATPLNGIAPFSYAWSTGATTSSITGLTVTGYYRVSVTDANGCTGVGYYYLTENTIAAYTVNNSLTCGLSNGTITLTAYNGTSPYSYTWSNSGTNHTNIDGSLVAGTYTYTVTDATGCSATGTDVLTAQGSFIVSVSAVPTSCNGNTPTGGTTVFVSGGGTAPFTFSWEEWNGQNYIYPVTSSGLTGLAYGDVVWLQSVTDANGCTDSIIAYPGTDTSGVYINYATSCYNDITGYAYTDLNGNCVKDAGEPAIEGINIEAVGTNGLYFYGNTDSNGFYDIQVLPGTYTVTAFTYNNLCSATGCTASYNATFTGSGVVSSGNNFGYSNSPSFDLVVHTGYNPSYPGGTKEYWVYYYNQGTTTVNNAVLTFVHDPNLTLSTTSPAYSSYNSATQTITWNIGAVPVSYFNYNQQITMEFNVPSNLPLGTLLTAYDSIAPTVGDCDPSNNIQSLSDIVTASHDPNSKTVSPAGNITASDSVLNYTIRFQNTGNAVATRVVIIDTLSPLVNPASVVVGASSHKYTYTLTGNGILTFTFDPIYLTDSTQNLDSSQGFVMYSVNVRNNDAIGSQITNTAYIYFDFNPAVVTNTATNTLSFPEGIQTLATGAMSINISPNPVHDKSLFTIDGATGEVAFEIQDIAGQKLYETSTTDRNIIFESEQLAAGIYIYTARDTKGNICNGKFVVVH